MNKKEEKGIWISEEEYRDLIWHLEDWAERQRLDSEYYYKKIETLRKRFKENKTL